MQRRFVTVDVFTRHLFGGNPLAVVLDPGGLTATQMQQIAAEFNLSETTFVFPPEDARHTAQVRIFTPRAELPFAGHPNIGTAFVLAQVGEIYGKAIGDRLVFEEVAGLVKLTLLRDDGGLTGARLTAPQPFTRMQDLSPAIVAAACGLEPNDIDAGLHQPCVASAGLPFVFAGLHSRERLAAASPRKQLMARHLPMDVAGGVFVYAPADEPDVDYQARMFAPLQGISEDPATGSANVALIGLLAEIDAATDLHLVKRIAQGVDMGRPSLLIAEAEKRDGVVATVRISGRCVGVMQGHLSVD